MSALIYFFGVGVCEINLIFKKKSLGGTWIVERQNSGIN